MGWEYPKLTREHCRRAAARWLESLGDGASDDGEIGIAVVMLGFLAPAE